MDKPKGMINLRVKDVEIEMAGFTLNDAAQSDHRIHVRIFGEKLGTESQLESAGDSQHPGEYKRKWNSISAAPAANGRWNL